MAVISFSVLFSPCGLSISVTKIKGYDVMWRGIKLRISLPQSQPCVCLIFLHFKLGCILVISLVK